jgi:hypothetical protein
MMRWVVAVALALPISGCHASPTDRPQGQASYVDFIQVDGTFGLTGKVKQKRFAVCLDGVSEADVPTWDENIQSVVAKWVKPLRSLTTDPLVSDVRVSTSGGDCDAYVSAIPDTHANTLIGDTPQVRMSPDGYYGSYNVLLHEFGHAFALGDTYVQGGFSGECIPGQPQAVMCNTDFDEPQKDDIEGIDSLYSEAFPGDQPPAIDPNAKLAVALYLALGEDLGNAAFTLGVAAVAADAEAAGGIVSLCVGGASECNASAGLWRDLHKVRDAGSAAIFDTSGGVQLRDGLIVGLRYKLGDAAVFKYERFGAD